MANRLAAEKSPYLLQHAENPVDWYPWGDEAFARARAEERPIFLSIGYATCHWCHVMERESFEDAKVAALLNERFVSIKVDREERPDVDRVYMAYVQATTGSGGWPMSVFLTPALEPFYGGTYFPPDDRYGRPGFAAILRRIDELWHSRRGEILGSAKGVIAELRRAEDGGGGDAPDARVLEQGAARFAESFDRTYAGFSRAPKFPRPSALAFLLRWFARSGDEAAADMVLATQHLMARGGMFDHVGGGFHRYSVDARWHVPHFEKMLYDQAQLVASYVEGALVSGDAELAGVARATCDYVLRDLLLPEGVFASAEDADSAPPDASPAEHVHKKEGAFYVWTAAELAARLGDDAPLFAAAYGVEEAGNAHDPHGELVGVNVLHAVSTPARLAIEHGGEAADVERRLASARARLFQARGARPRPLRDDKALTAWNGLMIGALARAGMALAEPAYVAAAARAATFLRERMWDGARLLRRYRDGAAAIDGYLDDHVFLASGLCDLWEATWDPAWLDLAEALTARAIELFHDAAGGAFFATTGNDPSVLVRMKDDWDGAEPAGSSVAAGLLLRFAELGRPEWRALAEGTLRAFASRLAQVPQALPHMLCAVDTATRAGVQIVIAGERDDARTQALLAVVHARFLPERTLILADARFRAERGARLPWVAAMAELDGAPAAYVCQDHACARPVTTPDELAAALPKHRA
jgi:uncharacterized protein YyaL (SSP411 family)